MKGFLFVAYIFAAAVFIYSKMSWESTSVNHRFSDPVDGTSITFVMGEDKGTSAFFEKAEIHFGMHPKERTDLVVSSMRSLEDVIAYLNIYGNSLKPWSTINLVIHGNPDTGLRTLITDGGHVATPKRLMQAALRTDLPLLNHTVVNDRTMLNVWGCGIGKNPLVQIGLEQLFRTDTGRSLDVYCSPHFVVFRAAGNNLIPERLKLSYWPYYFKRGYRPSDWEITRAMEAQFPEANVDWPSALQTESESRRVFQHSYHIPVAYTRLYPTKEARPDVSTDDEKTVWVQSQPELMTQVADANIAFDKFHWTVNKVIHTTPDGKHIPAIKAVGITTVLCVLQHED